MGLRLRCAAGLVLALFAAVPLAHSETTYFYAPEIKRACSADDDVNKALCAGFIGAELEIITNSPVEGIAACVPPLTHLPQAVAVVRKWLAEHPDEPVQRASLAVALALAEAFPCKK